MASWFIYLYQCSNRHFHLLRRENPQDCHVVTERLLREIANVRSEDRELSVSIFRFHACISLDQLLFNHEFSTDLNFIANKSILHVLRMHNGFQGAIVLPDKKWIIYGQHSSYVIHVFARLR